jgi:hypothetical protein
MSDEVRFDAWWSEDEPEPTETQPMLPDGRHVGMIEKAVIKDLKFKVSESNKNGTSLVVTVKVAKYQPAEAIIPLQFRGLLEAVCRAARIHPPDPREAWSCKELVGQTVGIETIYGIGKTGREYVRIDRWSAGPDPLPKEVERRPARTPAQKVEAAGQGGQPDDIPF